MKHRIFSLLCCATLFTSPAFSAEDDFQTIAVQTLIDLPISYHFVKDINPYDRYIELEDESRWKIPESDVYELGRWGLGHFVVITPNRGWFSDYTYYLTNQTNGAYVSANLLRSSSLENPFNHRISGMDQNTAGKRSIILDGTTYWAIAQEHYYIVDGWQPDDTVIIARNDAWFSHYNTILINVETNSFVKARKL